MNNTAFAILVHVIISAAYSLFWFKKNREESIYRFAVVFFLPAAGFIYFIVSGFLSIKCTKGGKDLGTLHGIDRDVERSGYVSVDFQKEINVVPLEEALIVNSGKVKRKLIVETFKEDVEKYISYLQKALKDEDTETSHYAAATVMEVRRRLTLALQEMAVRYERDRKNIETARLYADVLKRYLDSDFLDDRTYVKHRYIYSELLKNILDMDDTNQMYYIEKINCDLESGDYVVAKEYCNRFNRSHPDSEMPYIMNMKLFYILKDYKKFSKALALLKESDIRFSNNTLNLVRFWSGVGR